MIKKLITLALFLTPLLNVVFGQSFSDHQRKRMMDSIKNVYMTEAAIRNPLLRQITVNTDFIAATDLKSEYEGNRVMDGRLRQVRTSVLINVPVKSWGKNTISLSVSAFQQHFNLDRVVPYQGATLSFQEKKTNRLAVGLTTSFTRIDSLFGRRVIYTLSVTGLTSRTSAIEKLSYLGGMIFVLRQSANSRTSLGFLVNVDPSITLPVIPVFGYWHKFNKDVELTINIPQQVALRSSFSPHLWATFSSSLSGSIAFFRIAQPGIPEDVNYSSIELKTGPGVEYRFMKKLIVSVSAGMLTPIQVRAFDRTKNSNDYFLQNKMQSTPYVTLGLSVLPFL